MLFAFLFLKEQFVRFFVGEYLTKDPMAFVWELGVFKDFGALQFFGCATGACDIDDLVFCSVKGPDWHAELADSAGVACDRNASGEEAGFLFEKMPSAKASHRIPEDVDPIGINQGKFFHELVEEIERLFPGGIIPPSPSASIWLIAEWG